MSRRPSKEDSYDAYTFALGIAIVLTLLIAGLLRYHQCVPSDYFPFSIAGALAVGFVFAAFTASLLARGFSFTMQSTRETVARRQIKLGDQPQWVIELFILIPSVLSLCLLLYSSGGVFGPFNAYLGTFPIVVSFVSSSRRFIWVTLALTLGVYIFNLFMASTVAASSGHDLGYRLASLGAYVVSLAYTAVQAISGLGKAETEPETVIDAAPESARGQSA